MTRTTEVLNDTALDTVSGGLPSLLGSNNTIVHPHIPRSSELLTPAMIAKVLAIGGGIVPQFPKG